MTTPSTKYAKSVRRRREKKGLTQVALATAAGLGSGATIISRIEGGASCSAETRAKLDRVLDAQTLDLRGSDPVHALMDEAA